MSRRKQALYISLFTTFITIIFYGCIRKETANCHFNIYVKNNSNKPIYIYGYYDYPDSSLKNKNYNPAVSGEYYKVKPSERTNIYRRSCYEGVFKISIPSDTIMVYIFDAQTLETTPWETVKKNNLYLKRYDLSLQDLRNLNWRINYP